MNVSSFKTKKEKQEFYIRVACLVIPMALQNLINVGITMTDVIMLGKVGEISLSASNIAGQIQYIMMMIFFGLTSGLGVLASQYWGKRNKNAIEKVMGMAYSIAMIVAVIFTIAALVIPNKLMWIYIKDERVIEAGVDYLRIVAFSYILIGITMIYLNTMRSIERVMVSTVVYSSSLIINIILNWILIFGKFGIKPMGIKGAAIATLIARIVEVIIVLVYDRVYNKDVKFHISNLIIKDKLLFGDFIRFSIPVVANELLWGLGTSMNTGILGNYSAHGVDSASIVAANSVVQVTRQLATVVAFGIATSTAVIIGKAMGENRLDKARLYAKRLVILAISAGLAGAALVLVARPIAINTLELTPEAQVYLGKMMIVMSYFVLAQAFNTVLVVGIFRAGGDTKFGLLLDSTTMWCGSILFGIFAAFVFRLPVVVVYIIIMSDEVIKIPICWHRYKKNIWLKNITR